MGRDLFLYLSAGALLLGVLCSLLFGLSVASSIFVTLVLLFISTNLPAKYVVLVVFLSLFFCLGVWRADVVNQGTELGQFYDKNVFLVGKIYSEPSPGDSKTRFKVKVLEISSGSQKIFPDENVLVSLPKYPEYETGDVLKITGKLQKPENFNNENGIEFDYVGFLSKDKIHSLIYYGKATLVERNSGINISAFLYKVKRKFLEEISTVLPSPQAELMGGLLLGVKQSLGKELENQFRKVGLIHVVVLSGYNITIIIIAVSKFLSFLPRLMRYFLSILFVVAFAIMVGSGATVIRASIMTIILIIGKLSAREYEINRSLMFAGMVMVIHNPLIVLYDPSFQLSFIASLGLVNLSPKLSEMISFVPEKFEIRDIVSATTSTQIAVLPMILGMTGELSIVALPVNLIVLPLIPATMLLGFITGLATMSYWPLGLLVGFPTNLLLNFQLFIVRIFAELSFATIFVPAPGPLLTFLFYCFIIVVFYYRPVKVFKKVIYVLSFPRRLIVGNK